MGDMEELVNADDKNADAEDSASSSSDESVNDGEDPFSDQRELVNIGMAGDKEIKQAILAMESQKSLEAGVLGGFHQAKKALADLNRTGKLAPVAGGGVVYLGHIPFGFFEGPMRKYFSQFGEVTKIRLSRNPKTGKSRHYAFIEFANEEVAKIVAKTMNGYLLMERVLKAAFVPADKVHPKMWLGANRHPKIVDMKKVREERRLANNAPVTVEKHAKRLEGLLTKEERKREKLKAAGIDYDFPGYKASAPAKPTRTVFEDEEE